MKKELAIGSIVRGRLSDPKFMIPIRIDDVSYSDAPPEFIRTDILNAHPNWHDCLNDLFDALEEADVPKEPQLDAELLKTILDAREEGRRFVVDRPETTLTNWFPLSLPERVRYYEFAGTQEQMKAWLTDCREPHVPTLRLAASFLDPAAFAMASSFDQNTPVAYDVAVQEIIDGTNLGPYQRRAPATNDIANLLRQHFDALARRRGLLPVEFSSTEAGWFFPDDLIPGNRVVLKAPSGRRVDRVMSGKFKALRWHFCLIAKPRLRPVPMYRIHANVVLTRDGKTPLPGDKTQKRRRRLTKSWWNDIWRDRLLAAAHYLAEGAPATCLNAGNYSFSFASWPLTVELPVSYDASDPPMPREEDEEGTIVTVADFDDQHDDLAGDDASDEAKESE